MIRQLLTTLLLLAFVLPLLHAQEEMSWRRHRRLADEQVAQGLYFEAAENYQLAWEKKQSKEELIYHAAENYYRVHDYRNAASAYQHVPATFENDILVLLKYARSLKQDGQYDKARTVFRQLEESYTGRDKAILVDIINTELQGIDLAQDMSGAVDRRLEILFPGTTVNTENDEFGPVSMTDNTLWFSSTMGGQARLYESNRQGRVWTKATTPAGFPVVSTGNYGNGSLTPDGERFYFTICNNDAGWQDLATRCEIFMTRRTANGWGQPQRLPDFINMQGVNSTQPFVTHMAGQEYLFFSSNREGGRGGMDLWYATRDLGLDDLDFTFPVNLGAAVNGLGDEITPYYNAEEGVLYFASNSHPSIGGYDIFKTTGNEVNWSTPENAGLPINSSADDYGYVRNRSGYGGFIVSNRVFGGQKTNTRHFDVFEFTIGGRQIVLKGNVYSAASSALLDEVTVSLYQLFDDGTENLLITKGFTGGSYLFELLPNRRFRVEIKQSGFQPAGYTFVTDDPNTYTYGQPVFMQMDGEAAPDDSGMMAETPAEPTPTEPPAEPPTKPTKPAPTPVEPGETYTARGASPDDNLEYTTNAPTHQGTYFKIQLAAVGRYQSDHADFRRVSSVGEIQTEFITSRNLTRVLLADYFSESEVRQALADAQRVFPRAFIVRYDDGVRFGRVNL
ncbi:MAG: hypothetical protein KDC54_08885 [Lewinella sp.]|nr:hypothetical protein [Lewinella sp.]